MTLPQDELILQSQGPVAELLINRPARKNAFHNAMWEALPALVHQAMDDEAVRVLIIRAADGGTFCAGADIGEFSRHAQDAEWRNANQSAINRATAALSRAAKPVIAQIEGDCIGGGCGLALACDFRLASPAARFGITPAKLGIVYPFHDTKNLVDLVGPAVAKRLIFTGDLISSEEALRIGLADDVTEDVATAAQQLAQTMASRSQHTIRESKLMIRRIIDGQAEDSPETLTVFNQAFSGKDFAEGIGAFLEKRTPKF